MVNFDLEKKFFHAILENPIYLEKVEYRYFDNKDVQLLFRLAKTFMKKYDYRIPSKDQLLHILEKKNLTDSLSEDRVEIIYQSKDKEYDRDWYIKTLEGWIAVKSMMDGLVSATDYFKSQEITEENAQSVCSSIVNIINDKGLVSFHKSYGLDFFDPKSHYYDETLNKHKIGIPFFDKVTGGGISAGDLWLGIGETNVGKSIWLCNLAKSLVENGANVLYVSCEMNKHKVVRRIGSNMLNIPMADYFEVSKNQKTIQNKIKNYKESLLYSNMNSNGNLGSLIIEQFPTSDLDVPSLQNFIKENVEKYIDKKINVVVLDYINIMSNFRNPNSENTYMKIKQLAEDLRGMAVKLDLGVITVTQLKVGSYNSTDFNMEDSSESSGLGHTVDMAFGIIQDAMMYSKREYKIKILKNRDGAMKNSTQGYDIDYDYMRITEKLTESSTSIFG